MSTETKRRYSLDEYLALEQKSDARHECWDGEIFAMSGGTLGHERDTGNAFNLIRIQLSGGDCAVLGSNIPINVPS